MVLATGFNHTGRGPSTGRRPDRGRGSVLQAEGVAAFRGERLVLRNVSFTIEAGGALLLTGANGAGKSTLLRLLAGLGRPAAGRVLWRGQDVRDDLAAHAGRIAYVGHQDAVKPALTAAENLGFAARVGGGSVTQALAALGIAALADLPAQMLSAGQRRRLALARLGVIQAPLWLLDEPTLGLDEAAVERFGALLAQHRERGGVVVAATHLPLPIADTIGLRLVAGQAG